MKYALTAAIVLIAATAEAQYSSRNEAAYRDYQWGQYAKSQGIDLLPYRRRSYYAPPVYRYQPYRPVYQPYRPNYRRYGSYYRGPYSY